MELRQLQHFVALAEEQHFTRAARRVNIVQSALSTSIRQLETELDAQLVVRNTRQVRLTTVGKIFLHKARAALEAVNDAREAVAAIQGLKRGTLSIGTVQSLPAFLDLPSLIEQFHAQHPDIEVRLCQGSASPLLEKVRSGKLDLAFLPLTSEPPADVQTTMIACEALVLVCAPDHPLAGRTDVPLSALRDQPFVDYEQDWGTRKLIDRGFLEAGIDRHIAFEVSDMDTLLELVRRGLGVALLPEAGARTRLPAIGIAELAGPELCWELVVAYVGDHGEEPKPVDHAPRAFFELLRNANSML
ncbi:LysR substrate-binding domain-containing protein [Dyella flava]|uniref:LysR family transcriptional regulator n=1 Tax=Dyella flava TaxID=1920170 RepID=A0ABS2K1N3_9GAMM|nr:LysR substrate-binding domain-containing protein [Dyella flava]MBM7125133.1 LysR family transcriptional regulator [Dyella flava]GLQ52007.1 transcriptional regulator [Dyella flava]